MSGEPPLDVNPTELAFKVVPDAYSTKQLRLFNRGSKPMAFKIKTTNPKQYFVRPNQGVVKATEKIVIHVMMGKVPEIPKEKCKDRFLVQSAVYDGPMDAIDKFEWKAHFTDPNAPKPDEIKLKCSYITSDEGEAASKSAARPAADEGIRQRATATKPAPSPVASTTAKAEKTATKVVSASPPAQAVSPGYTMWLLIAIMFFMIGRYTTHVKIPGLDA